MSKETPWPAAGEFDAGTAAVPGRRPDLGADVKAFAATALASLVLALPVGALWRALAPAVRAVVSQGAVYYAAPEGKTFVARDGWFAVLAVLAAVLLAAGGFAQYRAHAGVGAALGLAAGGFGGAHLAARFGALLGPGRGSIPRAVHGYADGATLDLPIHLRAAGVLWLWPAFAVGLFFVLMLVFGPDDPEIPAAYPVWDDPPLAPEHPAPDPSVRGAAIRDRSKP